MTQNNFPIKDADHIKYLAMLDEMMSHFEVFDSKNGYDDPLNILGDALYQQTRALRYLLYDFARTNEKRPYTMKIPPI